MLLLFEHIGAIKYKVYAKGHFFVFVFTKNHFQELIDYTSTVACRKSVDNHIITTTEK